MGGGAVDGVCVLLGYWVCREVERGLQCAVTRCCGWPHPSAEQTLPPPPAPRPPPLNPYHRCRRLQQGGHLEAGGL